jgi:8-oxo-dGTP pyrophosphatase MutT (NUDIX family)
MYSTLKKYLTETLKGELPGVESHSRMLPPGRRLKTIDDEISLVKQSSVLILLFPYNNQLYTCLTRRPDSMKHHPGQISFPGGKVEDGDLSPEMTALREAHEEVGIDPAKIEILGCLSNLYVEVSRFFIHPFIGWVDQLPDFVVSSDEVEELILFPVSQFVSNELISEAEIQTVTGRLTVKYYPFNGSMIWGATAMILSELIEILKLFRLETAMPYRIQD